MSERKPPRIDAATEFTSNEDQMFDLIYRLLCTNKPPSPESIPASIAGNQKFQAVWKQIDDLRVLSSGLRRGELNHTVESRGYVVSNLKSVQANLKHLAWQSRKVAEGDYSQRIDFLGEIASAFNEMTTRLADATNQLVDMANLDTLTGVPNRLALNRFLNTAFHNSISANAPLTVLLMDIDHFKKINDLHGHLAGDQVLTAIAQRIQKQSRQRDFFARYGGEEFLAVLTNTPIEVAEHVSQRILQSIRQAPIHIDGNISIPVTVSIGISQRDDKDQHPEDITRRSDLALYAAKHGGRDQYRIYDPVMEFDASKF